MYSTTIINMSNDELINYVNLEYSQVPLIKDLCDRLEHNLDDEDDLEEFFDLLSKESDEFDKAVNTLSDAGRFLQKVLKQNAEATKFIDEFNLIVGDKSSARNGPGIKHAHKNLELLINTLPEN